MPVGLVRGYTRHLTPVSPSAARTDPLDRGLVGEWRFDPATGLVLPDYGGCGNYGAVVGADWITTDLGPALQFDGANDYVQVSDSASLDINGPAITLEAFFIVEINQASTVFGKPHALTHSSPYFKWCFYYSNFDLQFRVDSTTTTTPGSLITNDVWHHAVGVYDGADIHIYVDGQWAVSTAKVGNVQTSVADMFIAQNVVGGERFGGVTALARVYDRALSAAEVRARYQICLKRAQPMTHVWMMPWGRVPVTVRRVFITHT